MEALSAVPMEMLKVAIVVILAEHGQICIGMSSYRDCSVVINACIEYSIPSFMQGFGDECSSMCIVLMRS